MSTRGMYGYSNGVGVETAAAHPLLQQQSQPRRDYIVVAPGLAGAVSGAYFADKHRVAGGALGGLIGVLIGAALSRFGA